MRYSNRPVVVDAEQWLGWELGPHNLGILPFNDRDALECGWLGTIEGGFLVSPGDYIITGPTGKLRPCKPKEFHAIYEPIEDGSK